MATKKECDRCGKQWDPNKTGQRDGVDNELCVISVTAPRRNYNGFSSKGEEIRSVKEVCQGCARLIWDHLQPQNVEHRSA